MKLSEIKPWLNLLWVIPFVFIYIFLETGEIGKKVVIVITATIAIVFGILFFLNRKSKNKS